MKPSFKTSLLKSHHKDSIPKEVIIRKYSFAKLFVLIMFVIMGTTLLGCSDVTNISKSIDSTDSVATDSIQQKSVEQYIRIKTPIYKKIEKLDDSKRLKSVDIPLDCIEEIEEESRDLLEVKLASNLLLKKDDFQLNTLDLINVII